MKAVSYDRFGPIDVLAVTDRPIPEAGKGEVLVTVRASSVNVIDSRVRAGAMGPLVNKKFPKIPGADFAGTVSALGAGVTAVKTGDAVFGATDPFKGGAFAERVAVPAGQVAPMPAGLSFIEAAALPIAGLAALLSMRELGGVRRGSEVLIHGASGAVGLFAIQIAKAMGARVTAVAGTGGLDAVRGFGADEVIDYRTGGGARFDRVFDVILNASGKLPYALGKPFLTPAGRLVEPSPTIPVFLGSKLANPFRRRKHLVLQTMARRADLEFLAAMVDAGTLKPTIAKVFELTQARQAFAEMEKGGTVGKIIVTM